MLPLVGCHGNRFGGCDIAMGTSGEFVGLVTAFSCRKESYRRNEVNVLGPWLRIGGKPVGADVKVNSKRCSTGIER